MVLSNWWAPRPGIPERVHFTDHYYMERKIMDNDLGRPRPVQSHVLYMNELNGEPVSRTFSILSQKLWAHLQPFVDNDTFPQYDFVITEIGAGFYKDWNIQPIKRPE